MFIKVKQKDLFNNTDMPAKGVSPPYLQYFFLQGIIHNNTFKYNLKYICIYIYNKMNTN